MEDVSMAVYRGEEMVSRIKDLTEAFAEDVTDKPVPLLDWVKVAKDFGGAQSAEMLKHLEYLKICRERGIKP